MAIPRAAAYVPTSMKEDDSMNAPDTMRPTTSQPHGGHTIPRHISPMDDDDLEVLRAAETDACILLTGSEEARTLALRIHNASGWRWGRFVAVDCGGPERIVARQLFDMLREEARTRDLEPKPRLLQGGTIFLEEVGKLSRALQTRLTDALEEARLGGRRRSRMRMMAWTSEPLLRRVAEGTFDDRLFYLLNVIHLVVPPARRDGSA
jgi:DNA-binding NtrC family response regulator